MSGAILTARVLQYSRTPQGTHASHSEIAESPQRQGRGVVSTAAELLRFENAAFMLPVAGIAPSNSENVESTAADAYVGYVARLEPCHARRRAIGLHVTRQEMMYGSQLRRTELFNDFIVPHNLMEGITMTVDFADGNAAWLGFGGLPHEQIDPGMSTLHAPPPHIDAGVHVERHVPAVHDGVLTLCDQLPVSMAIFNSSGRMLHANPPLMARLGHADGAAVMALLELSVRRLVGGGLATEDGRTPLQSGVRASWIGPPKPVGGERVAVTYEETTAGSASPQSLKQRFGLTARESEVAMLIASGLSTKALAAELSISWHTVRRHTERVLKKLGVSSRTAVAAIVRTSDVGARPPDDGGTDIAGAALVDAVG